jgi:hypothetical protein
MENEKWEMENGKWKMSPSQPANVRMLISMTKTLQSQTYDQELRVALDLAREAGATTLELDEG